MRGSASLVPGPAAAAGAVARNRSPLALILLAVYAVVLAAVAFWPTPVDADLGRMLRAITRMVPVLTYQRIEFLANIALFVPLGILLAVVFARARHLVLPTVFLTTFLIECTQALVLPERTPSIVDMVANTAGGCAGLLAVAAVEAAVTAAVAAAHRRLTAPPPRETSRLHRFSA
ncbi:VanZ family protein [Microbacterium sp.]|uniref:VanZ family protein n=1 Tax=Microbacterium sp. TaxID=51671 RepID=UPI0039E4123A